MNVVFTVTDKHGHYVKDLKKDDFKVIDDNKPAKEYPEFSQRNRSALAGWLAGGREQLGARPFQSRKFSEVVLIETGKNDWVVDKLP